ncbi:MAG: hypothetical protein ABIN91_11080 [Mucilaginibacter sp.]|uniref:hypothetical protein n=1 Tax=Mucilaginibacter sp. TaxID=1882438 RepID=UPI003267B57D
MNKRAKKLFVVILNNQLTYCNTNLKALHASATTIPGYTDSYVTLFRRFQAADAFTITIGDKQYHFQKFVS